MLQDFFTDFSTAKSQSSLIPKGTVVKVKMAIKPAPNRKICQTRKKLQNLSFQ